MYGIRIIQFTVVEGDGLKALESHAAEYDGHYENDDDNRPDGGLLVSLRWCPGAGLASVLDGEEYKRTNRNRAGRDGQCPVQVIEGLPGRRRRRCNRQFKPRLRKARSLLGTDISLAVEHNL